GGSDEEAGAEFIRRFVSKPVVAYIAGVTAPPGKRMGHAGAIVAGGKGTAAEKYRALERAGVRTVKSPADLGSAMHELLFKRRRQRAKAQEIKPRPPLKTKRTVAKAKPRTVAGKRALAQKRP